VSFDEDDARNCLVLSEDKRALTRRVK
jgi:hypothetical protein